MPTPKHPRLALIDAEVAVLFSKIAAGQESRKTRRGGGYLQCLVSTDEFDETKDKQDFNRERKATGEADGWLDIVDQQDTNNLIARYEVQRYEGPKGLGYKMICTIKHKGELWRYSQVMGAESEDHGSSEWHDISEDQ